ncbi:MAG: MopE-related protein [Pseudomonadota bacterium]|nr:MopE-related protein [Pseudomonadota bacterium]
MPRPSVFLSLLVPSTLVALAGCSVGLEDLDSSDSSSPFPLAAALPDTAGDVRAPILGTGPDEDGDGYSTSLDCDDADSTVFPDATEADNLVDDDCDGWVDETFVAVGDIVFTEVNRQARFGGATIVNNGSWLEVYNTSARTVDLANWVLSRGAAVPYNAVTLDAASAPVLAPGAYAVFCDTDNYQGSVASWPLTCDYVWGDEAQSASYVGVNHDNTFFLRRDAETVALYIGGGRTTGTQVDSVRWTYDAVNGYWPRDASYSLSLDGGYRDATDNDSRSVWCSTSSNAAGAVASSTSWRWFDNLASSRDEHGTPGADNYACQSLPDLDADGFDGTEDCDDHDSAIFPGADDACDGVDNNCNGIIDDSSSGTPYYADTDADGYGDPAGMIFACAQPIGYVVDDTDCDDDAASNSPAGVETCDGVDNNCDGAVDEGELSGDALFYADLDADGFGDATNTTTSCTAPIGYTADTTDCDDSDASAYPAAVEADDLVDDDCDGFVDEDFVAVGDVVVSEIHRQARFGAAAVVNDGSWVEVFNASARSVDLSNWTIARGTSSSGNQVTIDPTAAPILAPGGYAVFCDTDNYEASTAAYPLMCDYVWGDETQPSSYRGTYHDNTFFIRRDADTFAIYANGTRTTGTQLDSVTWTYDATNGYWPRNAGYSITVDPLHVNATDNDAIGSWCSTSSGLTGAVSVNDAWRWYDTPSTTNDEFGTPGAANYDCPADNDTDADGVTAATDCNDTDATVYPGAVETCNSVDDDCDTVVDNGVTPGTWYADADGDSFGDTATSTSACTAPTGYVADATDCDDAEALAFPGNTEVCNDGVDNDCDPDPTVCEWSGSATAKADYGFRAYGTAASHAVGHSIANNGDFNGDGFDDVVIGQAYHDTSPRVDNGRVHMWYGPVDTTDAIGTADLAIDGDTTLSSDQFGWASRFAGDVDGDGTDDLLSSAWRAESNDRGRTYLFLGGSSPTTVADAFATFTAPDTNNYTGVAIDGGDVDGDGLADVMVSAYNRASAAGAVGIWNALDIAGGAESLTTDATLLVTGVSAGDNLGYGAVLAPDLDGDGLADLVLGAPAAVSATSPGHAYVFYGVEALSGSVSASTADAVLTGTAAADRFGLAVAGLGDIDGDGYGDLAVSADKEDSAATDAGALYVYTTAPSGAVAAASADSILTGEVSNDFFGRTVAGIGDVNGDGFSDLFVGATGYDADGLSLSGATYVVYGPAPVGVSSAATYDARYTGANTSDAVGYAVSGGGDVNADGYADFMTSAPSWDGFGYSNSGGAWLYYGRGE